MTKLLVESSPPSRWAPSQYTQNIYVPYMDHVDYIALMHAETEYHDPSYERWPFLKDEVGHEYEALIWSPRAVLSSRDVRNHFRAHGFCGNTAVFLTWILKRWPSGCFATIPEDGELFSHYDVGLMAPTYTSVACNRRFRMMLLGDSWGARWNFLAFRRVLLT